MSFKATKEERKAWSDHLDEIHKIMIRNFDWKIGDRHTRERGSILKEICLPACALFLEFCLALLLWWLCVSIWLDAFWNRDIYDVTNSTWGLIMSRKIVSSFSAEPAYLYLADYFAKKLKVGKGAFIRLCIADFAHRFLTAKEIDAKPLIRKWYLEVIEREIFGNTRLKRLKGEVDSQDSKIIGEGGLYGKQER